MVLNLYLVLFCIVKRKSKENVDKIWWSFNRNESMDKREKIYLFILLFVDVV